MGFNGIGKYTLKSGGHSVGVGISYYGNDMGGQYVGGDPCNPAPNGIDSNGTLEMSDQTKNAEANPADYNMTSDGPNFVAYTATVTNTTEKGYGTATFSLQGGGFS